MLAAPRDRTAQDRPARLPAQITPFGRSGVVQITVTALRQFGAYARVLLEPSRSLSVMPSGRSLIVADRLDAVRLALTCGLAARQA